MAGHAPIVLNEQRRPPVVNVAGRGTPEKGAVRGGTREEILNWRRSNAAVWGSKGVAAEKFETSTRSPIGSAVETIAMLFDSEFDGMLSNCAGDVIYKLIPVIRALNFRPIESTDSRHRKSEETQDVDARQSAIQRVGYAGVEPIRGRQDIMVIGKSGLVEAVIAEASFIDP